MSEGDTARLLADVEVRSNVCQPQGLAVQTGKTATGLDVTLVTLPSEPTPNQVAVFERILKLGAATGFNVEHRDGRVIVATPCSTGTVAHLPSLGWELAKRLSVFTDIISLVRNCHGKRSAVGALDPDYILLDEDLRPFLLGPGVAPATPIYCAPETVNTGKVNVASDIYALGKLLYFVVTQETPPQAEEDPPRLDEMMKYPAGLSRIIRKATLSTPEARYLSLDALAEDVSIYGRYDEVGLEHPDVEEENLSGLTEAPPAPRQSVPSTPPEQRVSVPEAVQDWSPFKLKKASRLGLLAAGVVGAGLSVALAYFAGNAEWTMAMMMLFAGLLGFALVSPNAAGESRLRPALAFLFATAALTFVPLESLAKTGQLRKLNAGDATTRTQMFKELLRERQTVFANFDLSGANLPDERFSFLQFSQVSFANANLQDTRFLNARLDRVTMTGAQLQGTWLLMDSLDGAIGIENATCDDKTRFPKGWSCDKGRPLRGARALSSSEDPDAPLPTWGTPAR